MRTSLLSLVALAVLVVAVIIVLSRNLNPPESLTTPMPGANPTSNVTSQAPGPAGTAITGTITVAPDLAGRAHDAPVLFIIAHKGPGAPFAVKRIVSPRFPLTYRLGPEDVMMAGAPFEGEVHVSARLSRSGSAGPAQPGDLEGEHAAAVPIGASGVDITLSRVH